MKICIFGAGAIGGHLAGRLAQGGAEVSLIARGEHLAAIRRQGLTIRAPDLSANFAIAASDDPAALGVQDAVIVTVKAHGLTAVASTIAPLLGAHTPVVFVTNGVPWWYFHAHGGRFDGRRLPGVDPQGVIWSQIGPERAIGGVVYSPCTVIEPGVVEVLSAPGRLILGEPDGQITARAGGIAAALVAGGLKAPVSARIRDAVWSKLLLNVTSGPLGILAQAGMNDIYGDPACADAVRRIVAETLAIAHAMGCPITHDTEKHLINGRASRHTPSIVQDLLRGRPLEIEAMLVAPLDLARLVEVPTPTLDLLVALATIRARGAGLYR